MVSSLRFCWQDYKEAFSKSDIFTCLLRLVMEGLDNEAGALKPEYLMAALGLDSATVGRPRATILQGSVASLLVLHILADLYSSVDVSQV